MQTVMTKSGFKGTSPSFSSFCAPIRALRDRPQQYIKKRRHRAADAGQLRGSSRSCRNTHGHSPFPTRRRRSAGPGPTTVVSTGTARGVLQSESERDQSRPLYILEASRFMKGSQDTPADHVAPREQGHYRPAPSADVTAFVEGWALYSSVRARGRLLHRPYSDFGRLTYESGAPAASSSIPACTRSAGRGSSRSTTDGAHRTSVHEVTMNRSLHPCAWPGTAYKMGELRITAARKRAEQALGSKFDCASSTCRVEERSIPLAFLDSRWTTGSRASVDATQPSTRGWCRC